ncbi:MAG: glycosyltransferase family 2 protein [Bacteroidales bacterium]|nr:glycosyltransferase family 2 protein [Bacteroidales bacterium]MBR4637121.1 glycosyltransferase family 2 protein [Bacteroidales bacterium]MBR6174188.1 glycosyltransferase family 2 protein [Bacteroidales bacterium]MBR6904362.1 glycosyltransferase family 2 protein [Bacteroidales bacterium]
MKDWQAVSDEERICVIVPTYNNEKTIVDVLQRIQAYTHNIIVVNDGSTPETLAAIRTLTELPDIVDYAPNRGKGYALIQGFRRALELGYRYAVTIDSDGQHFPEDIPVIIDCHSANKDALVVGSRNLTADNMPSRNTFANKFSNFWFRLQTGIPLEDTQSGFRLYPLETINLRWPITPRYEAELELLVFSAWRGVPVVSVPVRVYYPPEGERVSHFRPFWDFFRITVLNSVLTIVSLFSFIPARILRKISKS